MTGYDSKRKMAADKFIAVEERKVGERYGYVPKLHPSEWMNAQPAQEPWNEDEWRKNNWRCQHGWLRGEQCEICNAAQPAQEPVALNQFGIQKLLKQSGYDNATPEEKEAFIAGIRYREAETLDATLPLPVQPVQEPVKLWLWKNFVDGKPEYWAFDNPFPIFMDSHDPQTLGEPCGYALLKPSRAGRTDVSDEQVLQDVQKALAQPAQEPVAFESFLESQDFYELMQTYRHCLTDALLPFEEVKDALRAAHIGSKP